MSHAVVLTSINSLWTSVKRLKFRSGDLHGSNIHFIRQRVQSLMWSQLYSLLYFSKSKLQPYTTVVPLQRTQTPHKRSLWNWDFCVYDAYRQVQMHRADFSKYWSVCCRLVWSCALVMLDGTSYRRCRESLINRPRSVLVWGVRGMSEP